jgi:DNA-binding transcriptional LysR family regulator
VELRAVRHFVAVAETGSFRAAARRTGVSQPAVSQAVAALEAELGELLFDRLGRRISLTPAGRTLLDPARRAVADFDALGGVLERESGVVRGRLQLGTTDVASIYVLPRVYRAYRRRHPGAELSVRVEGTESLLRQLHDGALEIAIVTITAGHLQAPLPAGFHAEPLYRERLEFVVSGRHALAGQRGLTLARLAEEPLITFKEDSITRQAVDARFLEEGLAPRVAMEMSSPEAIKKLVEVGLGVSVLPVRSISGEVRSGSLAVLPVRGERLTRVLGVVRDPRRTPSAAAAAFLELLEGIRNVGAGEGSGSGGHSAPPPA